MTEATACFGGGNGENCYTGRPDNVSVTNGNLELTALIETYTATNNYGDQPLGDIPLDASTRDLKETLNMAASRRE